MLKINRILLPVDYPKPSLRVVHQAATLARRFHSEIVMLHVLTEAKHGPGIPKEGPETADWDMLAEIKRGAEKNGDRTLGQELDGLTIQPVLAEGNAAQAIVDTAQRQKADLIMMPCCGHTFYEFLLGTVAANATAGAGCPVWTDAPSVASQAAEFPIRAILCAVDFTPHDRKTVSWAAQMADEFGARLTLAHVTADVESWGPGGGCADPEWKKALAEDASVHIAELQREMSTKADVFIGSGDTAKLMGQAAKQTKADLLVTGCHPYGGRLRTHGYAIICAVPIPVLSV